MAYPRKCNLSQNLAQIDPSEKSIGGQLTWNSHLRLPWIQASQPVMLGVPEKQFGRPHEKWSSHCLSDLKYTKLLYTSMTTCAHDQ